VAGAGPPTDDELTDAARHLGDVLRARGGRLATAESATGGLIGHILTQTAGSSDYYAGGVVAYANDVKRSMLDVPDELLAAHGAVSAEVACAMASGAMERLASDVAMAVTGIAGPDGGSREKPVGLTYIAVARRGSGEPSVTRSVWPHGRDGNKRASALAAIELTVRCVTAEGA